MKQTKNFFLKLFDGIDKFDYKVINENLQKIDDALDELLHGGNIAIFPTMTIEKIENGHRITTKDIKGSEVFEILNGEKGEKGEKGSDATVTSENIKNALGYTPANENNLPKNVETWTFTLEDGTTINKKVVLE